jgi:phage antirepressor YoqD-like protein
MKKISTSALAKNLNIEGKYLFELLIQNKYIEIKKKSFLS